MVATLEDRFPVVTSVTGTVDGIIVLGGRVDQYASQSRKQIVLNNGSERLTDFVALARQFLKVKLVFTGGSGNDGTCGIQNTRSNQQILSRALTIAASD